MSFFSFFKVMTKKKQKNSRKTKKKQTWASDQTFSEKFWFFGFLVFSRFKGTSQLFDFSLGERPWGKPKNLDKTKKTKKPKLFENVWSEAHVCFFLVFLEFFWFFFCHDLEKTEKTQGFFFGFLKELLVEVRQETKKTQVFFGFWTDF